MSQPQLIKSCLNPNDKFYTPDWVAKDMVEFFHPYGEILEPCKGEGVFLKYLPEAHWCEIDEGRDFFQWTKPVTWIITNPPYSILTEFFLQALMVAENIVFLLPMNTFFMKGELQKTIWQWGWIRHIRIYGKGRSLNFPMGNPVAAFHFRRGYWNDTGWSWMKRDIGYRTEYRREYEGDWSNPKSCPDCEEQMKMKTVQVPATRNGFHSYWKCPGCGRQIG